MDKECTVCKDCNKGRNVADDELIKIKGAVINRACFVKVIDAYCNVINQFYIFCNNKAEQLKRDEMDRAKRKSSSNGNSQIKLSPHVNTFIDYLAATLKMTVENYCSSSVRGTANIKFQTLSAFDYNEAVVIKGDCAKINTFEMLSELIKSQTTENIADSGFIIRTWNEFIDKNGTMGMHVRKCANCGKLIPIVIRQSHGDISGVDVYYDGKLELKHEHDVKELYCKECINTMAKKHIEIFLKYLNYIRPYLIYETAKIDSLISKYSRGSIDYLTLLHTEGFRISKAFLEKSIGKVDLSEFSAALLSSDDNKGYRHNSPYHALWNDFTRTQPDNFVGEPSVFYVYDGCKHCQADIYCKPSDGFTEYMKIKNDPNYLCHRCQQWEKILKDLYQKFGWNPGWRKALVAYEQHGIKSRKQTDLNDLRIQLKENDIDLTDQITEYWNTLFEKYDGDNIIAFYASTDTITGKIAQNFGRSTGGLAKKISNFFS